MISYQQAFLPSVQLGKSGEVGTRMGNSANLPLANLTLAGVALIFLYAKLIEVDVVARK